MSTVQMQTPVVSLVLKTIFFLPMGRKEPFIELHYFPYLYGLKVNLSLLFLALLNWTADRISGLANSKAVPGLRTEKAMG